MDLTQSNKRPRATSTNNFLNVPLDLSRVESQILLSALQSIQEPLVIVEHNKIIHCNNAFQHLFKGSSDEINLTSLQTLQQGTSENLLQHIQRTQLSGVSSEDVTICMEGESKGTCSIFPLSSQKTLILIHPEKNITKHIAWNEFVEESNEVISIGIEYLPVSTFTNVHDGRLVFSTRSFADLVGLIDDPTGKMLFHELGLSFKVEEWYQLATTSLSPSERKQNFTICTFKSLDGKSKTVQCRARYVGLSEQKRPLLFVNMKEIQDLICMNNSTVLTPLTTTDLAVLGNPNTWKMFFDKSSIAMGMLFCRNATHMEGVIELINNDTDARIVITNPLGSVGIRPYLSDQIPQDQLKRTIEHYKQARLFGRPVEIEQIYSIKETSTFYTLICFVHIQGPYFLYLSQDISPLKNLREKEQVHLQTISQLSRNLDSTSLLMNEMNTIVSQMEQMLRESAPNQQTLLEGAANACHHVSTIMKSQFIHTVSTSDDLTIVDASTALVPSKISVPETIQQVKSILSLQLHKKDIQLNIDCPSDLSFIGIPDALRRLIVNLLFTITELSSPQNHLSIQVLRSNNNLDINITNTDLSLTAKETLHVMERITQCNTTNNNNTLSTSPNPTDQYHTSIAICQKLIRTLDAKLCYDVLSEDTNTLQVCLSIPVQCN